MWWWRCLGWSGMRDSFNEKIVREYLLLWATEILGYKLSATWWEAPWHTETWKKCDLGFENKSSKTVLLNLVCLGSRNVVLMAKVEWKQVGRDVGKVGRALSCRALWAMVRNWDFFFFSPNCTFSQLRFFSQMVGNGKVFSKRVICSAGQRSPSVQLLSMFGSWCHLYLESCLRWGLCQGFHVLVPPLAVLAEWYFCYNSSGATIGFIALSIREGLSNKSCFWVISHVAVVCINFR